MRGSKIRRSLTNMLYDRQISGKKFVEVKKSFQEVTKTLQGDRKK